MATYLVDRNGSRKSKTFEGGFFVVDFIEFFIDQIISKDAKIDNFRSNREFFKKFCKYICNKREKIPLAILAET
jgi:hypothetical protein